MARNRKYRSAASSFGPLLKALIFCVLIGGAGMGYVWQKGQINELGKQQLQREIRLGVLQEQNRKLWDRLAVMRSPQTLEQMARELNLGLGPPQQSQVICLPDPAPASAPKTNAAGLFATWQGSASFR